MQIAAGALGLMQEQDDRLLARAALPYADESLIVVDKPAGLLAVPGRGTAGLDCVSRRVQTCWADAQIVHRLDMATSGVMVFARGSDAQRALSRAFESRQVDKRYVAVVQGLVSGASGAIDLPMRADWPNRPRQMVDPVHGRASLTRWRVIGRDAANRTTRLMLEPVTGRSHQLRVHLAAIGHPIVGDILYGGPAARRLMLHACAIELPHPRDSRPARFESSEPF
jgi:tRNA pseudouridine32 synthase/23S rRNA pseudouridine746 synthase